MRFQPLVLGGVPVDPPFILAPMEGICNSAFRRLLSDFGGYGALTTEMLSAGAFLQEKTESSSFTRKRPCEGRVIYQFGASGEEDLEAVCRKLEPLGAAALDLNLGCPAPKVKASGWGVSLFRDFPRLRAVLERLRKAHRGPLTVKCRLGWDHEAWREPFLERLRLFEDTGVELLTIHTRFADEKLKRRARWELHPWIAAQTRLPVVGNGDLLSPAQVRARRTDFEPLAGLMLGRIAVIKPWIFREFAGLPALPVDPAEVWDRLYRYTLEDMIPERAYGRLLDFSYHYAKNFQFGHVFYSSLQKARTCEEVRSAALAFLEGSPRLNPAEPSSVP